ncbi:MAG: glutaminyl-peptide cyclotransferase [Anaerolineae bacterium]|nr:glutaminyl-peptide cyclotransferase [Anaerolineae bacterium]
MQRRQQLALRLLGVVGFVALLLILPALAQRCGLGGEVTPPPPPPEILTAAAARTVTAPPPPTVPPAGEVGSPLSSPLATPAVEPVDPGLSPLPTPAVEPVDPGLSPLPTPAPAVSHTYRIRRVYPHDPQAYTQGLVYHDGLLYESTGLRGRSSLRVVDLETGQARQSVALDPQFFGEGIAILDDRIYQLTWQANLGLIYDLATLERVGTFSYPGEGWGLTYDGTHLIMSDGTDALRFLDPADLSEVRRIEVSDAQGPVTRLNELEYVAGEILANVWYSDHIARIDPWSGSVIGWIDLSGLLPAEQRSANDAVLNGIAYDAAGDRLFVTGKLWPSMFEIELVPVE